MKYFVTETVGRFGISKEGTHASAVIFNSKENTKVTIRLNDYITTKDFQEAIKKTLHQGGNTRIDLAFKLAEEDIFSVNNGARSNVPRFIILLTDGKQNPSEFDPAQASQNLYNHGVHIFAIGIGDIIEEDELLSITRDDKNYFYAENFGNLVSQDFIENFYETACPDVVPTSAPLPLPTTSTPKKEPAPTSAPLPLPTTSTHKKEPVTTAVPCTDAPSKACGGVDKCTECCGASDVYSNIFHGNSGSHYVLQGMKLEQSPNGGELNGVILPAKGPTININGQDQLDVGKLTEVAKLLFSGQPGTLSMIGNFLNALPKLAQRKRRATGDEDVEELNRLTKIAKAAGCNLYFVALRKYDVLKNVTAMLKANKKVALFCPIDAVFREIYENKSLVEDKVNMLLNLIGVKHDKFGTMYRTLLPGGKVTFNPFGEILSQLSWKANDVDVLFTITTGENLELVVLKNVPIPNNPHLLDVLNKSKNVSIFRQMLISLGMQNVFSARNLTSICFSKSKCVPISTSLKNHLREAIDFNEYTIIAPMDDVFDRLPVLKLESLLSNPRLSLQFLLNHVVLGSLSDHGNLFKEIGESISSSHSLMTMTMKDGKVIIADSANNLFEVKRSERVTEGMLHIVDHL